MIAHQYLSGIIKVLKDLMGNNIIIHLVRQRYYIHLATKGESKGQEHKLIIAEK
jgi:hypothetical protein